MQVRLAEWSIAALLASPAAISAAKGQAQSSCIATPLSRPEAEQLLFTMPRALAVEKQGGALWTVEWHPTSSRADLFYFFQLVGNGVQAADGGNLGYYAVNKITGSVIDGLLDNAITGEALADLQGKMRVKHCVSVDSLNAYKDVTP
jgi:hypothetical protein